MISVDEALARVAERLGEFGGIRVDDLELVRARGIDPDGHLEKVVEHRGDRRDQLRLPDQRFAAVRLARALREIELLVAPAREQALRALGPKRLRVLRVARGDHVPLEFHELRERAHRIPAAQIDPLLEQLERRAGQARRQLLVGNPAAAAQVAQRGHGPDHDAALGARARFHEIWQRHRGIRLAELERGVSGVLWRKWSSRSAVSRSGACSGIQWSIALEHLEAIVDGPTIVTLGNYLKEHFLGEAPAALDSKRIVDPKLQHRADTIFSDLLEETPKK